MEHDEAIRMLEAIATAFNRHDLDGIMAFFTEDAVFETPRGPDRGVVGSRARSRCARTSPHGSPASPTSTTATTPIWSSGDRGASEWTLTGTTTDGEQIGVRGCDLWTFRDGRVAQKDSYWKIRTTD